MLSVIKPILKPILLSSIDVAINEVEPFSKFQKNHSLLALITTVALAALFFVGLYFAFNGGWFCQNLAKNLGLTKVLILGGLTVGAGSLVWAGKNLVWDKDKRAAWIKTKIAFWTVFHSFALPFYAGFFPGAFITLESIIFFFATYGDEGATLKKMKERLFSPVPA